MDELARGVLARDRRSLAKAITLIESTRRDHVEQAERLLELLLPESGGSVRAGVSGAPGVGKSTFIEALGLELVGAGQRVAVLAVDPSSRISGGSILGDKTRMPRLAASAKAFIRPSPTGGTLGGVSRRTRETTAICEAAGYDVVLIETVGVGQSETAVADMVDVFVLLLIAGAGDELQGIKRGIMELADVVCVNKADGDNVARVNRAVAEVHAALGVLHSGSPPAVLGVSALEGRGITESWTAVLEQRERLARSGALDRKRADQETRWFWTLLKEGLEAAFLARPEVAELVARVERELAGRTLTAGTAARRVLALAGGGG